MSWGFESLHAHKAVLPAAFFHFHLKNILCDEDFCRSDSRADDDATADDDAVLRAATDDGTPKRVLLIIARHLRSGAGSLDIYIGMRAKGAPQDPTIR